MSWSREQCEILIQEYQKHSCLYATKSLLYKNKHARQDALRKIQAVVQEVKPAVTVHDIKSKFNGLKTNFMTEFRKWKESMHSGAGDDSVYKPTVWYFENMFFLLEHSQPRPAMDSIAEEMEKENISQEPESFDCVLGDNGILHNINHSESERPLSPVMLSQNSPSTSSERGRRYSKKRKLEPDVAETSSLIREASSALASISQKIPQNNEDDEAFARFIITKLKKITNEQVRMQAEQDIFKILYSAIEKCQ